MSSWLRRKDIDRITEHEEGRQLVRSLSWPHLMALGIGAIVGTGIYTLIGTAANLAGPAVLLSFVVAGIVCACAALAYAEMATMMPAAGSAYTYSYAVLGEALAWIVGWSLILEYTLVVSAVAVGWSGQVVEAAAAIGVQLPTSLVAGPEAGGLVNLPAVFITFAVAGLLIAGLRESATFNAVLVVVKLVALAVFVAIALPNYSGANLEPFMPFGFGSTMGSDGVERGVMAAAAIIFFAFYGFDAISTAAEEAKNPGRDLSIGIVGSMIGCTLIYLVVALAAVGAMSYVAFAESPAPLALIMREMGHAKAAGIVAGAAVVALPTVILAFFYGQSRIFFVMARDGLLPRSLSKVSARGTPVTITVFTALLTAALAGIVPLGEIAALANAGTLAAFTAVAVCLLVLRVRDPGRARVFRTPLAWVVGPLAIVGCAYLFWSLPLQTKQWFLIWNGIGIAVYLLYSRRNAVLGQRAAG